VDNERWAFMCMVREKMNVQESYDFIVNIKKIMNKEGEWVTELIATYLQNKNKAFKPTYENILNGINKEKEKYCVNLIEPLFVGDLVLPNENIKIRELNTEMDLRWAGKKLSNCMNNPDQSYAQKIKSGKTKLFVIMTENNMSGLELRLIEDTVYQIVQILSYCNRQTSEYHKTIGNLLINYLNMKHLKEIYESKMSSYVSIDLLNRGFLVNLKDEKTDKNPTGLFLGAIMEEEPVTEDYMIAVPRLRNINLREAPIVPINDRIEIHPVDEVVGIEEEEEELVQDTYEEEGCIENPTVENNNVDDTVISTEYLNTVLGYLRLNRDCHNDTTN
jgi:hypothetical protein